MRPTLVLAAILLLPLSAFALDNPSGTSARFQTVDILWPDGVTTTAQCTPVRTRSCVLLTDAILGAQTVTFRDFPQFMLQTQVVPNSQFAIIYARTQPGIFPLWSYEGMYSVLDLTLAAGRPAELHSQGLMQHCALRGKNEKNLTMEVGTACEQDINAGLIVDGLAVGLVRKARRDCFRGGPPTRFALFDANVLNSIAAIDE